MIQINKNYAYGSVPHNFVLYKAIESKDKDKPNGKLWLNVGYYSSLSGLLKALASRNIQENIEDLKTAETLLNDLKKWIDKNVPKIEP